MQADRPGEIVVRVRPDALEHKRPPFIDARGTQRLRDAVDPQLTSAVVMQNGNRLARTGDGDGPGGKAVHELLPSLSHAVGAR
jgi:hypothetical protein